MDDFSDYEYSCEDDTSSEEDSSSEDELEQYSNDEEDDEEETTGMPFLTKFEKARIIGIRTQQILAGSKIFVETNETDPYKIALQELLERKMPLIIRRYFGSKYKDISVNKLRLI